MHIVNGHEEKEGPKIQLSKSVLLFLAITLHNIPEAWLLELLSELFL